MKMSIRRAIVFFVGLWCAGGVHARSSLQFVTESFPPFNYEANGAASGPMVDVLQAVCEQAQLACSVRLLPWRRAIALAEGGQVDGIFSILHGPGKAEQFFLSDPVIATRYSFFASKQSGWQYRGAGSLSGMVVGVYGPSSTSTTLAELVSARGDVSVVVEVNNYDALKKLSRSAYGTQAAVFINRDVGLSLVKSMNLADVVPVGDVKDIHYCFGLSRKSSKADERAAFTTALRQLKAAGKLDAIVAKYGLQGAGEAP